MKNILLLIFVILIKTNFYSQSCITSYNDKLKKLKEKNEYNEIVQYFDSIGNLERPNLISYHFPLLSALERNDTNRIKKYLFWSIQNQDFSGIKNIYYNYPNIKNYIDTGEIASKYDSLNNYWNNKLNYKICKEIDKFYFQDQFIRELYDVYSVDSQSTEQMEKMKRDVDTINEKALKEICLTLGRFPGVAEIGNSRIKALQIILVHILPLMDSSFYYPMIQKSVLENNLYSSFLPSIVDRYQTRYGNLQLYGTITEASENEIIILDVLDVKNVDKRREYFCLPTLAEVKKENSSYRLPKDYEKE